jgi:hypothetical protein
MQVLERGSQYVPAAQLVRTPQGMRSQKWLRLLQVMSGGQPAMLQPPPATCIKAAVPAMAPAAA